MTSAKEQLIQELDKEELPDSSRDSSRQARSLPPFLQFVEDISAQVPTEEWAKLPSDLSKNLDHYLYGLPKDEE